MWEVNERYTVHGWWKTLVHRAITTLNLYGKCHNLVSYPSHSQLFSTLHIYQWRRKQYGCYGLGHTTSTILYNHGALRQVTWRTITSQNVTSSWDCLAAWILLPIPRTMLEKLGGVWWTRQPLPACRCTSLNSYLHTHTLTHTYTHKHTHTHTHTLTHVKPYNLAPSSWWCIMMQNAVYSSIPYPLSPHTHHYHYFYLRSWYLVQQGFRGGQAPRWWWWPFLASLSLASCQRTVAPIPVCVYVCVCV